ncbi:MAG: DNA replication/repair protein RecF [Peptococcaceae bacterium]|jgi:DNA replication and repair protein RecF|nr:DNA replication/repair protein RecF [Peptococcaceae bacterium]
MLLQSLELKDYRNYQAFSHDFSPSLNIFQGKNAQGKTNLIEAIYYLSIGRSYRPVKEDQLVRWEQKSFLISGKILNRLGVLSLETAFSRLTKPAKQIYIGGLKAQKPADMLGNLNSVLFAPEDLSMIKGSPQERRNFLDYDISQVSTEYFQELHKYRRLLAQRNHLLKQIHFGRRDGANLSLWDEQLLASASQIVYKRLQALEKLNPLMRLTQRKLTGGVENLDIKYFLNKRRELKISDDIPGALKEVQRDVLQEETRQGVTLWGPHRDDLSIVVNGMDLKLYGSQGQHRTAVLALKLSELEFFRGESGEYPILLLDDVMSELDEWRRNALIQFIQSKEIQCFITTTDSIGVLGKYEKEIRTYQIQAGQIK